MSDNEDMDLHTEEEESSLWEFLNEDNDDDDEHEALQEEQDEEDAKAAKLERKLSSKMENMQKKFEETMLRERLAKFEESADDVTKELFKTVASDVKTVEDFDKAAAIVAKQKSKLEEVANKYKEEAEKQAAEQAARAWGTGPIGTGVKKGEDYESELMKKVAKGDPHATLEAIMGDAYPF